MSYPYRITLSAVILGIALLAAGCGSSSSGRAGGADGIQIPPSPGGSAEGGPAPLNDSGALPASPALVAVTPAPGTRERVVAWHVAGRSEDGRRLLLDVSLGGPPCDAVTAVEVEEDDQAVTVTVHAGRLTGADCPAGVTTALGTFRVEAELERPLGDRRLLGGP